MSVQGWLAGRDRGRIAALAAGALLTAAALAGGGGGDAALGGVPAARGEAGDSASTAVERIDRSALKRCGKLPVIGGFRCGSIRVPKFRSAPEKGTFEIGFALRPRNDRGAPSRGTIVAVEGGPGYASTGTANSFSKLFGRLLDHRELVLVDMRGTGLSGPIRCPDLQTGRAPEWIALSQCARRLGDDFEAYNTGAAAEDIDAVRRALGLGRITLYGDSYGTFLSQSYAFRHPDSLNAVVLDGAYPVRGESPWYPSLITAGNENMEIACERAPDCPPSASRRLKRLAKLMRRKGMNVGTLIDAIAGAAYGPPSSYLRIDRAGRKLLAGKPRDWRRLTLEEIVASRDRLQYDHAEELVVGCNDYPMIWDRTAREPARRAQLERAIRDYDPKAFAPFTPREVAIGSETGYLECLTWPRPTELREPPVPAGAKPTTAPVLVVNGELDDLTTPFEGRLVADEFPHSRRFIGRNAGHVDALYDSDGPSARAIRRFLRNVYTGGSRG